MTRSGGDPTPVVQHWGTTVGFISIWSVAVSTAQNFLNGESPSVNIVLLFVGFWALHTIVGTRTSARVDERARR